MNMGRGPISRLDRLGMVISGACLIHCLVLPLLAASLPFLAVTLPGDAWVHRLLLGMALPVTGFALLRGWQRHRAAGPAIAGMLGLAIIAFALTAGNETSEAVLTVTGGLIVVYAHLKNWRAHYGPGT